MTDPLAIEILRVATAASAPFFWGGFAQPGSSTIANGTAFLLDCGEGPFLVTAAHVILACTRDRQLLGRDEVIAQFGEVRVDPEDQVISINRELDLATIHLTTDQLRRCPQVPIRGSQRSWPPPPIRVPQAVFFSGFPGTERTSSAPRQDDYGIYSSILITDSVSDTRIIMQVDQDRISDFAGLGLPAPGYDMGGVSGAALLTLVECNTVLSWHPAGVLIEASPAFDTIFATPIRWIDPDGSIRPVG